MKFPVWRSVAGSGVGRKKISGVQGKGSGLVGGTGGGAPGRRRIFEIFQKITEENCKKCCIFA